MFLQLSHEHTERWNLLKQILVNKYEKKTILHLSAIFSRVIFIDSYLRE